MRVDLLAGATYNPAVMPSPVPTILVFDSGLGGLTVFSEVLKIRPDARYVYAADDAGFPYGRLAESVLAERVVAVMERLIELHDPDIAVVACNTASTLVLPYLRARFSIPFVGTVPAIKPAAQTTQTGYLTVLATPATVARDYTRDLIETYAAGCKVNLVGSRRLAGFAEAELAGSPVSDEELLEELGPCFIEDAGGRTDVVALSCTHYPLLLPRFQTLAPWPVTWIDPAPAIARRVTQLIGQPVPGHEADENETVAVFTSGAGIGLDLREALREKGLPAIAIEDMPLLVG
ncbi:glutamate racemase [Microvirga ossetica]|uniref:Glutamate racemase n=1 Tax=Microvirga ossetica TaxID=1882682 RepID=A0A1B2EK04_9HYPH|nr:glutamate racemase [Microvirga ossetica]ANY80296.1 glutamate racemase [Microvirga ossetica]